MMVCCCISNILVLGTYSKNRVVILYISNYCCCVWIVFLVPLEGTCFHDDQDLKCCDNSLYSRKIKNQLIALHTCMFKGDISAKRDRIQG